MDNTQETEYTYDIEYTLIPSETPSDNIENNLIKDVTKPLIEEIKNAIENTIKNIIENKYKKEIIEVSPIILETEIEIGSNNKSIDFDIKLTCNNFNIKIQ
jgi:hypothetical protein